MNKHILSLLAISILVTSCKDSESPGLSSNQQFQLVNNYSNILEAGYEDAYNSALTMQSKINAFISSPSAENLREAQNAWLAAREPYMQTEMSRFYGGPIDGNNGDGLINSWPLDEGYIDYLSGDSHGHSRYPNPDFSVGIINMPVQFPEITTDILVNNNQPDGGTTNQNGDNVSVSVGYHAIEFLLWGQDDTPAIDKIPGQRAYKDYINTAEATAPNGSRRAVYLQTVTQLVIDNLKELVDAWAPNSNNYRKTFEANPTTAIANMFNGIGRLAKGELAGERMGVPLVLHAQEQEHSCFSDNTHRDLILDMQGIVNSYYGTYTRTDKTVVSGLGLSDFVKALNASDDTQMKTLLSNAQSSLKTIEDHKPFDWLIDGNNASGNEMVQKAVTDVSAVADWISQIAHDLKLSQVNIPESNP
ncbi:MAG: hypothetical protein JST48_10080 [Bacteroidetes bacterium]|nr:hypothetical protein [Bacteroidota bacterium]